MTRSFFTREGKSHINYTSKLGPRLLELASRLWEGGDGEEVGFLYKGEVEPREKGMYVPRLVGLPRPLVSEMCVNCLIQNVCLSKRNCKAIDPQNMHNHTPTHSFTQDMFIKHLLVAKYTGRHSEKNKRHTCCLLSYSLSITEGWYLRVLCLPMQTWKVKVSTPSLFSQKLGNSCTLPSRPP